MLKLPKVVKVLTARGDELPATTHSKARRLVRDGRAKYISYEPRTIQLLSGTGENGKLSSQKALVLALVMLGIQFIPVTISSNYIVGVTPASAMTVYDPTNHKENLQTKLNTIEQLAKQAQQLQNEAANLAKLDPSMSNETTAEIRKVMNDLNSIRKTANVVGNSYEQAMANWDEMFPDYEKWNACSGEDYAKQVEKINKKWEELAKQSTAAASVFNADNQEKTANQVEKIVAASQNAEGAMGAIQAANQLAAITVGELQKMGAIIADSAQTQTLYYQKQLDAEKAGRKRTEEFYANQEKYKNVQIQDTGAEIGKFKDA